MQDRLTVLEPLHGGAVGSCEPLRAGDDRGRDRIRVELEGRDLLLRPDDLVQAGEARAEPFLVALALADVAKRDVDAAVCEEPAGVLRLERGAVLAAVGLLAAQLAAGEQLAMAHLEVLELIRVDELVDPHAPELVDGVPEQRRGGVVGVRENAVAIADEDRVGGLGVQLAIVALALGETFDELCVPQRDRRGPREQAQRLHLGVVEGVRVGAPDSENAADRSVVFDLRQDDRSRAGREAPRDLGPGGCAEHGEATAAQALVGQCCGEGEGCALKLGVGSFADLEVRELVVDRGERRAVRAVELHQPSHDPVHDRLDLARERRDLELPFDRRVESSADHLGIPRPSAQFSAFGLAMLDAKTLGEFEALEGLVRNA